MKGRGWRQITTEEGLQVQVSETLVVSEVWPHGVRPPPPRPSENGLSLTHSHTTQGKTNFLHTTLEFIYLSTHSFTNSLYLLTSLVESPICSLAHSLYNASIHPFIHLLVQSTHLFAESLQGARPQTKVIVSVLLVLRVRSAEGILLIKTPITHMYLQKP